VSDHHIEDIAAEAELNALLDAWRTPAPDAALIGAIIAAAPQPRTAPRWMGWLAPLGLSAGLAAACAAGLFLGVQVTQTSIDRNEAVVAALDPTSVSGEGA
jgi:anti-sigma factor RsiW